MVGRLALVLSLCSVAYAQDDDEGGLLGGDDVDIDLSTEVDIDFGDEAELVTYEGSHTQTSGNLTPNARVAISHSGGNVSVRCTDAEKVTARLDFSVSATKPADAKRYGDSFRLSAWGKGASAGAKVSVGGKPSSVKDYDAALVVSVPSDVNLTISAGRGWIEAIGCNGSVTANAGKDGAYVSGQLKGFRVSAATGDVKVILKPDSGLANTSSINATKGGVKLVLPHSESAKLDVRGESVNADMAVTGSTNSTTIRGTIGDGKPMVTVRAGGAVKITTRE
jgi:hypothetical protein